MPSATLKSDLNNLTVHHECHPQAEAGPEHQRPTKADKHAKLSAYLPSAQAGAPGVHQSRTEES